MNTHLMGASGLQPALYEGSAAQPLQCSIVRDGAFSPPSFFFLRHDGHLLPVLRRTGDRTGYGSRRRARMAGNNGSVRALDGMVGELNRETFVSPVRLGDDQQARGVLVDAMDDTGASYAPDAGKLPATMVEQGVDQRPVQVPRSRMDDEPRRLVDNDQVLVLEHDDKRNVLSDRLGRNGGGDFYGKWGTFRHLQGGLGNRLPGQSDPALAQKRFHTLA